MTPVPSRSSDCGPIARLRALTVAGWLALGAAPLAGQQVSSLAPSPALSTQRWELGQSARWGWTAPLGSAVTRPQPTTIRWYHAAAAAGVISLSMLLDEPVQDFAQDHRSQTTDDVASVVRHFGQPEVYATVSVGLVGVGLIAGDHELARVGGRAVASVGLAGASALVLKSVLGRARPFTGQGVLSFHPFNTADSTTAMPSGHTSVAFALATSLSDDIHRPWATVGLYTLATATAWSRINDDQHWFSDVVFGAIVGVTSAKLASGRWEVFGIHTPSFLVSPSGNAALTWHATF
ncbi:MAG TPA: phosphatase PAP2 family protein [Gemmatimonadales bacterium]|nr:phosphatase PAP2 family protein [Gemmatimonadales bacterium]